MDWRIGAGTLLFLVCIIGCASAEKVAHENASVGYFISLHDCAVAISDKCAKLNMASEFIFNESNSMCTWWCRPVRGQNTSSTTMTSSSSTSSSTTSSTQMANSSSSPDYTIYMIAGACILVLIWQIVAYVRSLGGVK